MAINVWLPRAHYSVPAVPPVFDPSNTDGSITLSGSDLTATANSGPGGITRTTTSKSSGKWCVDVQLITYGPFVGGSGCGIVGLVTPGETLSNWLGQGAGTWGHWTVGTGRAFANYLAGSSNFPTGTSADGDYYRMCWDADAGDVWLAVNNVYFFSGNPATATSPTRSGGAALQGEHYVAAGPRYTGNQVTLQATPVYALPSGFTYWTG